MRKMTGLGLLALFLAFSAQAELAPLPPSPQVPQGVPPPGYPPPYPPPGYQYQQQQNSVPIPEAMRPQVNPPTTTLQGNPRYNSGDQADYNTEQRQAWLEKCEPLREVDFKGFKKCFETEKKKTQNEIKRRFREVESRQGQPFRNVSPGASMMDETPRNPAFEVDVEKK